MDTKGYTTMTLPILGMLQDAAANNNAGLAMIGKGLGAGLALIGTGLGIGRIGGSMIESMARQPELAGTIEDLFETITLYDNRATQATAKRLSDGRYEVSVEVLAKKRRADEVGRETDVPLADRIDVGVLDAEGKAIVVEKRAIDRETQRFTFVVDRAPARAGIDPFNKLIDRRPKDNTMPVTIAP